MSDDLEKAITQAYDPLVSDQLRSNAMAFLQNAAASANGWRAFLGKLFETGDVQIALVCISALSEIVLHRYVLILSYFF